MPCWFLALPGSERNTGKFTSADLSDDEIGEFFPRIKTRYHVFATLTVITKAQNWCLNVCRKHL